MKLLYLGNWHLSETLKCQQRITENFSQSEVNYSEQFTEYALFISTVLFCGCVHMKTIISPAKC